MSQRRPLNQPEENLPSRTEAMIRVNLRDDWREFIEAEAPKLGLRYSAASTLEQNTIAFLNARRRNVPRRPRVVQESCEFLGQNLGQHATDYLALKKLISEGGDLTPYLSRDVLRSRAEKNDKTLNSWGVHHIFTSAQVVRAMFCSCGSPTAQFSSSSSFRTVRSTGRRGSIHRRSGSCTTTGRRRRRPVSCAGLRRSR